MLRTRIAPLITCLLASAALLAGCSSSPPTSPSTGDAGRQASAADVATAAQCPGVWLEVDFDILGADIIETCIASTEPVEAMKVLETAGVTITGTADYGLDVVCRVNGLPAADQSLTIAGHESYRETCAAMPPEFGYWSVWVEDRATGTWDYATAGIDNLKLAPGESLGFTFTSGTHTDPPIEPLAK